jgi:hypothetical protein
VATFDIASSRPAALVAFLSTVTVPVVPVPVVPVVLPSIFTPSSSSPHDATSVAAPPPITAAASTASHCLPAIRPPKIRVA